MTDDTSARAPLEPDSTVKATFTPRRAKRPKQYRETLDYLSAARRFIRAAGARVADSDEVELEALISLRADLDEAIRAAVQGQRAIGRSWAHIARATGTSREAAFQRWGKK